MRILTFLSLLLLLAYNSVSAQNYEVGAFGGVTTFHGDLTAGMIDFKELNIGYGAFFRFYPSSKFSFRLAASSGTYSGNDANSDNNRGFAFKSSIHDLSFIGEWNLLGINIYGPNAYKQNRFSPYLFLGVGANMFTPDVTTNQVPLNIYDEQQEYSQFSMVVPAGLGFKYAMNKLIIGLEASIKIGLNDYLDGISKSGNSNSTDWYSLIGLTVGYRLGGTSGGYSQPTDYMEDEVIEENTIDENLEDFDGSLDDN